MNYKSSSSGGGMGDRLRSDDISLARPHHIPKMDSLSKRMEEIRLNMSNEVKLQPITKY